MKRLSILHFQIRHLHQVLGKPLMTIAGLALLKNFFITDFPFAREENMAALCEIDLSDGISTIPLSPD